MPRLAEEYPAEELRGEDELDLVEEEPAEVDTELRAVDAELDLVEDEEVLWVAEVEPPVVTPAALASASRQDAAEEVEPPEVAPESAELHERVPPAAEVEPKKASAAI